MSIKVRAKYEGRALRPFRDIGLREGEEVEIEIRKSPVDAFHGKMKIPKSLADEIEEMELWD